MGAFVYTALEPSGKHKSGVVEAPDKDSAVAKLLADGRFVLEIHEDKAGQNTGSLGQTQARKGRIQRGDVALFSRRVADLAAAGLPLDRVLQIVTEQSESLALQEIAASALADVRTGIPVSQALAKYPKVFNSIYTETLRAGEASGQFAEVTARLADFQEKDVMRRSQVVSALIYPAVLSFTAVGVVTFLLLFVVPRLSGVFHDLGSDLPISTRILLSSTDFLTAKWIPIVVAIGFIVIAFKAWSATERGALMKDWMVLRLPLIGSVILKSVISRYARTLGTLVFGGVPILESLRLSGMSAGNRVFLGSSKIVEDEVREGKPIAEALRDARVFPPVLTHMVAIGEETGDLPKMLGRVSDSLDFEVDNGLRRLTSLVEPIIVLGMGGFVGFVVLSVLLPIFQAQNLVK